jgi:hypothetical protein
MSLPPFPETKIFTLYSYFNLLRLLWKEPGIFLNDLSLNLKSKCHEFYTLSNIFLVRKYPHKE